MAWREYYNSPYFNKHKYEYVRHCAASVMISIHFLSMLLLGPIVTLFASPNYSRGYDLEDYEARRREFGEYLMQYNIELKNGVEWEYRLGVFTENLYYIDSFNSDTDRSSLGSLRMGITRFAHWTTAEFAEWVSHGAFPSPVTSPAINTKTRPTSQELTSRKSLDNKMDETSKWPDSLDWVSKGAVTPVKDQGRVYLNLLIP